MCVGTFLSFGLLPFYFDVRKSGIAEDEYTYQ